MTEKYKIWYLNSRDSERFIELFPGESFEFNEARKLARSQLWNPRLLPSSSIGWLDACWRGSRGQECGLERV